MKIALLIPIYEPTEKVLPFLSQFEPSDFDAFLVVDDGSGTAYQERFASVKEKTPFDVVGYGENQGKGYALKLGMAELIARHPDLDGIVTADGDGQHTRLDILRVKSRMAEAPEALVLGVRDFSDAPKRSVSGNLWMSRFFRLNTGRRLNDTQTGLRGIPSRFFDLALSMYGRRYEYEMNFLTAAAEEGEIDALPIETIYENNNAGSHFRAFRDSMRFVAPAFWRLGASMLAYALDLVLFYVLDTYLFASSVEFLPILGATSFARILSAAFVFLLIHFVLFRYKGNARKSIGKFLFLTLLSLLASSLLTYAFRLASWHIVWVKAVVDLVVGILKFALDKALMHARRHFLESKAK